MPKHFDVMDSTPSNEDLILNDYDKLYLLMAKWKLASHLFNPFCYVCNIKSIADLERQLYSNWREFPTDWLRSWQESSLYAEDVSTIKKMVEESRSVNLEDLPELLGIKKNHYKEKLEEAGVHLISKEKLSLKRKIALGRPYSGDVYQAKWTKCNGTELNVVLRYDLISEQREMFLREASMLCNIKHDNVMILYGAVVLGSYAGSLGLVVELFSKGNLEEFKISSLFQAWLFSCQLSSALEYLEDRQVVHTSIMTPFTYVSSEEKIKIGGFMFCYSKEEIEKAKQSEITVISHQGQRIDHLDVKGVTVLFAEIVESMFRQLYLHLKSLKEFLRLIPGNNGGTWYPPWGISSLLERCILTDLEARPSFNEIVNILAKGRPKKLCFTVDYSSTEANELSYVKGEKTWVILEDPASYQGMWLGQKEDGKIGFFIRHNTVTANIEQQVPYEIRARGIEAELAYKEALLEGKVQVSRARLLIIGQDRAGKTSLKKSLLGLPFDPNESSTEGLEVNPSRFEMSVEQVVDWKAVGRKEFAEEQLQTMQNRSIAKLVAEKLSKKKAEAPAEETKERSLELEERESENAQVHEEGTPTNLIEDTNDQVSPRDQPDGIRSQGPQPTQEPEIHMPSTLQPLVAQCLKDASQPKEENIETKETVLDIWDFAGQHLYYATHSVFFSHRAIYLLVYNLSKKLNDLAEPLYRQGAHEFRLSNLSGETNLQTLQSWMASVHSIRQPLPDHSRPESGLPYRPPPILIVGTHEDEIADHELKQVEAQISSSISDKEYQKHVLRPFYAVNNRLSSQSPGVKEIQERVVELLTTNPYLNEDLPVKWLNFEKAVKKLAKEGKCYIHLDEVYSLARKDCFVDDEKQLEAMLNFYHDLGVILRFKDTVVTDTKWLIELFRNLITIRPFKDQEPVDGRLWEELETKGILHPRLIDRVFGGSVGGTTLQQSILDMMEMYGFVAKFCCHGQVDAPGQDVTPDGVKYFVPAQLTVSPEDLWNLKPQDSDPCPLLLKFRDGIVPHGLFPQLVSRLISRCHELKCFEEPKLFCNGAQFGLGKRNELDLVILCSKRYLKLVLRSYSNPLPNSDEDTGVLSAYLVRSLIEDELKALRQQWHWLGNASYDAHVLCVACESSGRKECTHKNSSCSDPDSVDIIPISPDKPRKLLTCSHQFGEGSKFEASGLDKWYIDSRVEEQCPARTLSYASVDSINLVDLAGEIPAGKWKLIGRLLGIQDPELDRIQSDENDAYERCYKMLATWKQRQGKSETCKCLERALCHEQVARNDLARRYCYI